MGQVAVTFRLMPEGPETEMKALEEKVRATLGKSFRSMQTKPFAFGLNALFVIAIVEDAEGATEKLESALSRIEGVQTVETVDLDLL